MSPCLLPLLLSSLLPQTAELERAAPELLTHTRAPGFALARADATGVTWTHAVGFRSADHAVAVDADTRYGAASLSKPLVAYALLRLVDEEVLELDRPLVDYAPLPDLAHDPRHRRLTARHVLAHTTGLPNWRPRGGRLEFEASPGERWGYSGEGFVLLAGVAEELTGLTLEELCTELVFEPLGMGSATFAFGAELEDLAPPHDEEGRPVPVRGAGVNAAASLTCTVTDYARFLSALLRGEGLSEGLVSEMRRAQARTSAGVAWGLGLGLEDQPGGPALWQWGHNGGYRAFAWLSPSRGEAFVWFCNGDGGMLVLRDLLRLATGVREHPALDHLGYRSWDDPPAAAGGDAGSE